MKFKYVSTSLNLMMFCFVTSLVTASAAQCGSQGGGALCPNGLCCSTHGWCGTTNPYCGPGNCQSQCPTPSPPPPPSPPITPSPPPPPVSPDDVSTIITESLFEKMLPNRGNSACEGRFYTYNAFISAARTFPAFGRTGSLATRKRELAAFFGQTSHETTGGWADAPGGPYAWGYCFVREIGRGTYCSQNQQWPCVAGQQYYGRGPIQLTHNYNYGPAGQYLGQPLLSNPDLVATNPVVSFETALWFWMTPQYNKPSCHSVIVGSWIPTSADLAANRLPGYGVITNIINGGLECGIGPDARVQSRIGFFERYCDILGVSTGDNLDCFRQRSFNLGYYSYPESVLKMVVDQE